MSDKQPGTNQQPNAEVTFQDKLAAALRPPTTQEILLGELKTITETLKNIHPSWDDKIKVLKDTAANMLNTYKEVEKIQAAAGHPPAASAVIDPALIQMLVERERLLELREEKVSDRELSSQFNVAAAHFGVRCSNSIDDIKAAFSDKREELVALDAAFATAVSERSRNNYNAGISFALIVTFPLGLTELRQARKRAEEADRIVQTVDIEANRRKAAKPNTA